MPASPSLPSLPVRRGVTLLELLVVLVLMGIAAAVVAPALRPPAQGPDGMRGRSSVETLVADARRTAIRNGEPLRLRLDPDGVWALVSFREGNTVGGGRVDMPAGATALDLRIDAMGSCAPAGGFDARLRAEGRTFDPLSCAVTDSGRRADGETRAP